MFINRNFVQKSKFCSKIEILFKMDFFFKIELLVKMHNFLTITILLKNIDFSQKSKYIPFINFLVANWAHFQIVFQKRFCIKHFYMGTLTTPGRIYNPIFRYRTPKWQNIGIIFLTFLCKYVTWFLLIHYWQRINERINWIIRRKCRCWRNFQVNRGTFMNYRRLLKPALFAHWTRLLILISMFAQCSRRDIFGSSWFFFRNKLYVLHVEFEIFWPTFRKFAKISSLGKSKNAL